MLFRIEEIEQTNTVIHLGFKVKHIDGPKKLFYRLLRSRSLGEFVPFYTSAECDNGIYGCDFPT